FGAEVAKRSICEVAAHRRCRGDLHGERVMRAGPRSELLGVAALAARRAYVRERERIGGRAVRRGIVRALRRMTTAYGRQEQAAQPRAQCATESYQLCHVALIADRRAASFVAMSLVSVRSAARSYSSQAALASVRTILYCPSIRAAPPSC